MASLHRQLDACFWARAYWLHCQDREDALALLPCVRRNKLRRWTRTLWEPHPAARLWGLAGARGQQKPSVTPSLWEKKADLEIKNGVNTASSRRWVVFILLMNYLPNQICLRNSWVTQNKPLSRHSLPRITYLNNIILVLISFLFCKLLVKAVNLQPCQSLSQQWISQ